MAMELDCRGLQCPEPVARCRALLNTSAPPALRVLVGNPAALENVSRFLSRNGYTVTSSQEASGVWRVSASQTGAPDTATGPAPAPQEAGAKTVVLLTSDVFGRGDDGLGAKLMTTFLANLSELGPSLWRVILLNGGVRLACGEAAEQLRSLEASGVGVLVCGTCLMHYGLLEQKKVGETTNMMDVLSSLALAAKVIAP